MKRVDVLDHLPTKNDLEDDGLDAQVDDDEDEVVIRVNNFENQDHMARDRKSQRPFSTYRGSQDLSSQKNRLLESDKKRAGSQMRMIRASGSELTNALQSQKLKSLLNMGQIHVSDLRKNSVAADSG